MKTAIILITILFSLNLLAANGSKDIPYETVTIAGVTLNYRVTPDLNNLDCQMLGSTTGWVGVGFVPGQGMQSANFIIGYDTNGTTHIRDDWGVSPSSHASDTSLGGSSNIISSSSSEAMGTTQINFIIPLNSGDSFDRVLAIGQTYNIILGRGQAGTDNFTGTHAEVGSAQITLVQPVGNQDDNLGSPLLSISSYPNPFQTNTNIVFQLKANSTVGISIYNSKGQLVKVLTPTIYQKGGHQLVWNGRDDGNQLLPAGIYFARISAGGKTQNLKLILIK